MYRRLAAVVVDRRSYVITYERRWGK